MNQKIEDRIDTNSGCYQLILLHPRAQKRRIGRLGTLVFPAGTFIYTGSHQTALGPRIFRHLKRVKKRHWHIDYLTTSAGFIVRWVAVFPNRKDECRINQSLCRVLAGESILKGFGATDCQEKCDSHLCYQSHFSADLYLNWLSNYPGARFLKVSRGRILRENETGG